MRQNHLVTARAQDFRLADTTECSTQCHQHRLNSTPRWQRGSTHNGGGASVLGTGAPESNGLQRSVWFALHASTTRLRAHEQVDQKWLDDVNFIAIKLQAPRTMIAAHRARMCADPTSVSRHSCKTSEAVKTWSNASPSHRTCVITPTSSSSSTVSAFIILSLCSIPSALQKRALKPRIGKPTNAKTTRMASRTCKPSRSCRVAACSRQLQGHIPIRRMENYTKHGKHAPSPSAPPLAAFFFGGIRNVFVEL